jgi:pantoate--beta-alanine ligase
MERIETPDAMVRWRRAAAGEVGLVPTMGYLHDGHLSLVRRARAENQLVVVSIFVNPTQFGANEDFSTYPRDLKRDLELLDRESVDVVFLPSVASLYPEEYATYVTVEKITARWEGASRPGHFRGVATIVLKLFNIVRPDRAYFGQKDYQQLQVVRRRATDLNLPIAVVTCPIVREPDGLAMSSRNAYLSLGEREAVTVLFRALKAGEQLYKKGERSAREIQRVIEDVLSREPQAKTDYVAVADPETLDPLPDRIGDRGAVCCLAVRIGKTRLIDNLLLLPDR